MSAHASFGNLCSRLSNDEELSASVRVALFECDCLEADSYDRFM
jgi:hypothetical protein